MDRMWRPALVLLTGCLQPTTGAPVDAAGTGSADAPVTQPAIAYHGTLAATPPVAFGGGAFCNYTITLKQLDVVISLQNTDVSAATVQALDVEATDTACPYAVMPPAIQKYTLETAKPTPTGSIMTFSGDPSNATAVALSVVTMSTTSAQLTFHRTDQAGALAWTVTATVPLAKE
ncbi:hypothetical protein BH11MYX1_BH11MYX1_02970 [soil metagenome]